MDALTDLSWRAYPALALIAVGLTIAVWGIRLEIDGLRRPIGDPAKTLTIMRGFRLTIIGLTLAGVGAAWNWHIAWLFILSLVIGGEETLETSVIVYALRRHNRLYGRLTPSSAP